MAIWPFNRKQQSEQLPEEVQEYYDSSRKQQTGMAWLLALGTLIVTVVLALLIFFGGRWVYNQFFGDDETEAPTTSDQTPVQPPASEEQPATDEPADNPAEDDPVPAPQPNPTPQSDSAPQTSTPDTGSSTSEIPNTGPGPGGLH